MKTLEESVQSPSKCKSEFHELAAIGYLATKISPGVSMRDVQEAWDEARSVIGRLEDESKKNL